MTPRLIAIEGIDGSGKTTVSESLGQNEPRVYVTGEMLSPLGTLLRRRLAELTPVERIYWFAADRASLLAEAERNCNSAGIDTIVYDRYIDSARAFRNAEFRLGRISCDVVKLVERVNDYFPEADVVIYLDLDPAVAEKRLRKGGRRADDRLPYALSYYRQQAAVDRRYITVGANRSKAAVLSDVRHVVRAYLENDS